MYQNCFLCNWLDETEAAGRRRSGNGTTNGLVQISERNSTKCIAAHHNAMLSGPSEGTDVFVPLTKRGSCLKRNS